MMPQKNTIKDAKQDIKFSGISGLNVGHTGVKVGQGQRGAGSCNLHNPFLVISLSQGQEDKARPFRCCSSNAYFVNKEPNREAIEKAMKL